MIEYIKAFWKPLVIGLVAGAGTTLAVTHGVPYIRKKMQDKAEDPTKK